MTYAKVFQREVFFIETVSNTNCNRERKQMLIIFEITTQKNCDQLEGTLWLKGNEQYNVCVYPEARSLTMHIVWRFTNYQGKWSLSPEGVDETVSSVVKSTIQGYVEEQFRLFLCFFFLDDVVVGGQRGLFITIAVSLSFFFFFPAEQAGRGAGKLSLEGVNKRQFLSSKWAH